MENRSKRLKKKINLEHPASREIEIPVSKNRGQVIDKVAEN